MIQWLEEVKKYEQELVQLICGWVKVPSVYDESTIQANAPFGKGVADAFDFILKQADKDQFKNVNDEGYACHIEYGEGDVIVGVLGHADVVPEGDGWTNPPFSGLVQDGKIYGRGTQDDKGPIISSYIAMKIIRDLGLPISKKIRIIIGGNEERDWQCVDHYFKKYPKPDLGFTPDGSFPLVYAEKVISVYECKGVYKNDVVVTFKGGNAANSVIDHASAQVKLAKAEIESAFNTFLQSENLVGSLSEDEYTTIIIEGVSAHGSTPEVGVNAGIYLLKFLSQITNNEMIQHFSKVLACSDGSGLNIKYQDDKMGALTMNVGIMEYIDGNYRFVLDTRYPMAVNREAMHQAIEQTTCLEKYQGTCDQISFKEGIYLDLKSNLIQTLYKAYTDQTQDFESKPIVMGGGTYARAANNLVCFGMLLPNAEELFHQKDEAVKIQDVLLATAIYAQALYELAK